MRNSRVLCSGRLLRHAFDGFQQKEELLGVHEHGPSEIVVANCPDRLRIEAISFAFSCIDDANRSQPECVIWRCQ